MGFVPLTVKMAAKGMGNGVFRAFGLSAPLFEVLFADAAGRTCPIIGDVLERSAGNDAVFRVSLCRIINVSAGNANILFHIVHLLKFMATDVNIRAMYIKKQYLCRYGYKKDNKGMDAPHRNGDGSIHLSFVSYHAAAGSCGRACAGGYSRYRSASADLFDAIPDLLPYRTEGSGIGGFLLYRAVSSPCWVCWRHGSSVQTRIPLRI